MATSVMVPGSVVNGSQIDAIEAAKDRLKLIIRTACNNGLDWAATDAAHALALLQAVVPD